MYKSALPIMVGLVLLIGFMFKNKPNPKNLIAKAKEKKPWTEQLDDPVPVPEVIDKERENYTDVQLETDNEFEGIKAKIKEKERIYSAYSIGTRCLFGYVYFTNPKDDGVGSVVWIDDKPAKCEDN